MQRLFLDANIVLDLLGERTKFYLPSAKLATLADRGVVKLVVSPITYATVSYFLTKYANAKKVKETLRNFKVITEICLVNENIIEKSLNSEFNDFEDALQYFCAIEANCNIIITRNKKDFKHSAIPVMTADEYLKKQIT
jgi:predicted nucleic acid-binding protein